MASTFKGSELIKTALGRQYHIGLKPGEVARNILLCGDPDRAKKAASLFSEIKLHRQNREFVCYTGKIKGLPISVLSTGIGPDNMEITIIELSQIVNNPTLIRIGSCGALKKQVKLGDLVISTAAVRMENTSTFFVPEGYPAASDHEVLLALISACESLKLRYHVGITASACGFYGAQGRSVAGFTSRAKGLIEELSRLRVLNFEMEISVLFSLASLRGLRAGAVCTCFAERISNKFVNSRQKERAEIDVIKAGIKAFEILDQIDKMKNGKKFWVVNR